ncbi:MAG: fibronectin type III domain-containing protein [Methanomassiliicoccus sp.]|nr:fibronectin type III domain-containing protein [Methanomassiliicoccus sp.]
MRGALIGGTVAAVAIVLAVFLVFPSLLPSGLMGSNTEGDSKTSDIPKLNAISPSSSVVLYTKNITLEWTPDANADSYVVLITVPGGSIGGVNLTSTTNNYDLGGLLESGSYLWTVQAVEDGRYGPLSEASMFTIRTTLVQPTLLSPSDGSVLVNSLPTLRWSGVTEALGYRVEIAKDTEFSDLVVDVRLTGTSYSPTFTMEDEAVYSWRVAAYHDEAFSHWSAVRQFSHNDFLAAPLPLTPVSGATVDGSQVNLTWSAVESASGYRVQVSTSASFASTVFDVSVSGKWYLVPMVLQNGTTYYWRVQAVNGAIVSSWSASVSFLVPADSISFSYSWSYGGKTWTLNGSASGHDYYYLRSLTRTYDYASYVMDADPTVIAVANQLKSMAVTKGYGGDLAQFFLAFVQGVPYTEDQATTGRVEYPRYPVETLVDHGGDCEDKSALYASLMQCTVIGVDAVMLEYTRPGVSGHMAVGIVGSFSGTYYEYGGTDYFYCETTGVGWKVGQFPSDLDGFTAEILPC